MICEPCRTSSPGAPSCAAKRLLESSPYFALRNLSCRCEEGRLVIHGQLASFYEKQLAQEVVARVEGIVQIVNEIQVVALEENVEKEL